MQVIHARSLQQTSVVKNLENLFREMHCLAARLKLCPTGSDPHAAGMVELEWKHLFLLSLQLLALFFDVGMSVCEEVTRLTTAGGYHTLLSILQHLVCQ